MEDLDIVFDPLPADSLRDYIMDRLAIHNVARTGRDDWYPICFFLKAARGDCPGGLLADMWGGWLHVRFLWLAAEVRGQRYGSRLMDAAEAYAAERGCTNATLETQSFEAPGFYQKRGYEVFATLEDCPPGHQKHYLRKRLA